MTAENSTVYNLNKRCLCNERIAYRYQCKHEYAYDRKLHLHKYDRRWFNSRSDFLPSTLLRQVLPTTEENSVNIQDESIDDIINNSTDEKTNHKDEHDYQENITIQDDSEVSILNGNSNSIGFGFVMKQAESLVKFVQSDKDKLHFLSLHFDTLLNRLQNKKEISLQFDMDMNGSMDLNNEILVSSIPISSISKAIPGANRQKRKMSYIERNFMGNNISKVRATKNVVTNFSQQSQEQDSILLNMNTTKRCCSLCGRAGHTRLRCLNILSYNGRPLPSNDWESRLTLTRQLNMPHYFKREFVVHDKKDIFQQVIPITNTSGIVLHILYKNDTILCTILDKTGEAVPYMTMVVFSISAVSKFVGASKTNIVISELELESIYDTKQGEMSREMIVSSNKINLKGEEYQYDEVPSLPTLSQSSMFLTNLNHDKDITIKKEPVDNDERFEDLYHI